MPHSHLDHLVVTAPTLAAGVAYVQAALGVAPQPGGRHPRMGTHNCLLKLGPRTYLEVIAVDPGAGEPGLPRWFGLDQARERPPRLATWVARTDDIQAAAAPVFGRIEPMERGALRWSITLPEQGGMPFDGVGPALIQWHTEPHPAATLPESGCSLIGLDGRHAQAAQVAELLRAIGFRNEFKAAFQPGDTPGLVARILTPGGVRTLS
jgi:hypothetical protein